MTNQLENRSPGLTEEHGGSAVKIRVPDFLSYTLTIEWEGPNHDVRRDETAPLRAMVAVLTRPNDGVIRYTVCRRIGRSPFVQLDTASSWFNREFMSQLLRAVWYKVVEELNKEGLTLDLPSMIEAVGRGLPIGELAWREPYGNS